MSLKLRDIRTYSEVTHASTPSIESSRSSVSAVCPLTTGELPFVGNDESPNSLWRIGARASSVDRMESFADGEWW